MEDLTMTAEELQQKINEAVQEAVEKANESAKAKYEGLMANQRKEAKEHETKAIKEAVENANLTTEEKTKKEQAEKISSLEQENAELKAYKRDGEIKDALAKEKLPLFLVNDGRLKSANTEEELAEAIKLVKQDYDSSIPNGALNSTDVVVNNADTTKSEEDKELERNRHLGL